MGLFPPHEGLRSFNSTPPIPGRSIKRSSPKPASYPSTNSDFGIIQSVLKTFKHPRTTVTRMDILPSPLHRLRRLHLSDASILHLSVAPLPGVQLLRHERRAIETEALTLNILRPTGLPVPGVIQHDTTDKLLGAPFLLTTSLPGTQLSKVAASQAALVRSQRPSIDSQVSRLASIVSSTSATTFGPVPLVAAGRGFRRWREAYRSMLCEAIKDAEDAFVHLPYAQIWDAVSRNQGALDEIKDSMLVVPGLTDDENVLVETLSGGHFRVSGFVGFGKAFWGDVEMGRQASSKSSDAIDLSPARGKAYSRQQLYAIYYAVLDIAVAGFRPQGSEQRDLEARRRLTSCLENLRKPQICL